MIAHYRPIFITFLALAFGIWLASLYYYGNSWAMYLVYGIFAVMLVGCLISIFVRCKWLRFFANIKWHVLTMVIPMMLGMGLYHITYANLVPDFEPTEDVTYGIYGTVHTNYITKEKGVYFIADNVQIVEGTTVHETKYNVFVYIYYEAGQTSFAPEQLDMIKVGNQVILHSRLLSTPIFDDDEINSFAYKMNFEYSAFVTIDDLTAVQGKMGFWDSAREYIRDIYNDYMSPKYAGLAFSILVGDSTQLDSEIINDFQVSGIMHVVAVSGLNTAFIMLLLLWVLRKLKANKYIQLIVVIVILTFYSLLCAMTPSVVRASLMSIFLLVGQLFGKQSDNLNSIALSGILLLLLYPLYVFDLSFLLSYLGVFGIFLLYRPLAQWFTKVLKFKKLAEAIALMLSATIATSPIVINAFGYFSIVGFVANIVLVPEFGYAFMLLFFVTLFSMLLPFVFGYLLKVVEWGFVALTFGAKIFASVPYASIELKRIPTWALTSHYVGMFASSRYCVIQNKVVKLTVPILLYLIFVVGFVLSLL